ncbi:MAG: alanine--glyoxylate aminotransferase family protein, partial [Acidobacteriota bacterium]
GQTAYTPAVSLIDALNETTREILRQDPKQILAEADLMSRCTRKALLELGFSLLSSSPSSAVTAAFPPEGISATELVQKLEREFGIRIAGGQSELKGKIIRIAHLGHLDLLDVFSVLSAIELCLLMMGTEIEAGSGLRAALLEAANRIDVSK